MLHVTFVPVHITFYNVALFILQCDQVVALRRQSSMRCDVSSYSLIFQVLLSN